MSPIVKAQGDSLSKTGISIEYFLINGHHIFGYLKNLPALMKTIKKLKPNVIHAHYSFCGIVTSLSTRLPVVTSLMGSDVKESGWWRQIIRFFVLHIWDVTIVKSDDMRSSLGIDKVRIIPNGVDLEVFKPMDKVECREMVGWGINDKIVLFAANPDRPEKNFQLAKEIMKEPELRNFKLQVVYGVKHQDMPLYINASDVLLLTSLWEGSPNVVKEAMACRLPIVSTDVGDVGWLFGDLAGYFICNGDEREFSQSIMGALAIDGPTDGRSRIKALGLDSVSIASKLVEVYKEAVNGNKAKRF